jgi:glycosyltransferase involved in cell wall biosynthesis
MFASKPVVATNVGGAREAISDGKTGFLVASDDDRGLAKILGRLLNDVEKTRILGVSGRKVVVEQFSMEKQLENACELYENLLNNI